MIPQIPLMILISPNWLTAVVWNTKIDSNHELSILNMVLYLFNSNSRIQPIFQFPLESRIIIMKDQFQKFYTIIIER